MLRERQHCYLKVHCGLHFSVNCAVIRVRVIADDSTQATNVYSVWCITYACRIQSVYQGVCAHKFLQAYLAKMNVCMYVSICCCVKLVSIGCLSTKVHLSTL